MIPDDLSLPFPRNINILAATPCFFFFCMLNEVYAFSINSSFNFVIHFKFFVVIYIYY